MSKQEQNRKFQREAFSPGNHQQDSCVSMALGGGGRGWEGHGHMSPINVFPRLGQMFRFALMVSAAAGQICIANVTQRAVRLLRVPPPSAIKLFFCPKVSLRRTNQTPWTPFRAAGVTGALFVPCWKVTEEENSFIRGSFCLQSGKWRRHQDMTWTWVCPFLFVSVLAFICLKVIQ